VRTTTKARRLQKLTLALAISLAGLLALAGIAQAASPAWKLLAATGPTNLPPKQSEVQKVTVEAEGGTFALSTTSAEGEGTLTFASGIAETTAGSNQVHITIPIEGTYEAGQSASGFNIPLGTIILGVSGPASEPTLELSNNAESTEPFVFIEGASKEVTGVTTSTGQFAVGEEVSGPGIPPATTIASVGSGTLTLSNYVTGGGTVALSATSTTAPIPFNASSATLQSALDAMPGFSPGTLSASGGPGGTAEHPYFIEFGGPFAEQDVAELEADSSNLVGEHAFVHVFTTVPGGPGTGEIAIDAANIGGAPTLGPYTVTLGPLPAGIVISGPVNHPESWSCPDASGESTLTCTSTRSISGLHPADGITVPVEVEPSIATSASAQVTISGGGAGPASTQMPITISRQEAPLGAAAFWAGAYNADGEEDLQAGGHPYSAMSDFLVTTVRAKGGTVVPAGDSKNVVVDLPPGFLGNPMATKRCPQSQLTRPLIGDVPLCNKEMTIGVLMPTLSFFGLSAAANITPLYNNVPAQGYAAEFTTVIATPLQSLLGSVRGSEDFGIRITAPNNPNYLKIFGAFAAIEGFPEGAHGKPFLRSATDCAEMTREPPIVRTRYDTWQNPGVFSSGGLQDQVLPPVTGCDKLEFHPGFSFQPTSTQGSSAVGATANVHIPQDGLEDPNKLATPDLKRVEVHLPAGLNLNPSSANGLESCSEAQIGYRGKEFPLPNPIRFDDAPPSCPDGSKLGTMEIETPLLEETLNGTIYLAAEHENPFGSLIGLYLVINDARTGINLKLPGEVRNDPNTGQLSAIFDYGPQLPFEDLTLHFRGGGPRSLLATPEVCGNYETTGSWTPWSAPESGPPAQTSDAFNIQGNCSSSDAARPFNPSFEAGTTNPIAGAYSPLVIKLSRKDGEQELRKLDFTLPPGLLGKLAGVGYCPDSAIATAKAKSGKAELASASCPADSHLGSVDATAGVGSEPIHVGGEVYLAGPYEGAPLSAVTIVPAVAGPIDLGNVVLKSPLRINPETAKITATSGQIPTILEGIPAKLRSVSVKIDRPDFTLNPTSCEAMDVQATAFGSSGAISKPTNRFQVEGCEKLSFGPKVSTRLFGPTQRGGFPRFKGTVTAKPGEANTGKLVVTLPHSEFLEQGHIRTVCTRVQFAANQCPQGSIYGHVAIDTPLLSYTLEGNAYLRSSNHKLPDLVLALKGPPSQPVEVEVAGRIDANKKGIRTTFESVPDAPFTKATLTMQGGKKGLLVNSRNICGSVSRARATLTGHNGKLDITNPVMKNGKCGGGARKHGRKGHRGSR